MKEFDLDDHERYRNLIDNSRLTGELWVGESEGVALILRNDSGDQLIPVWPSAEMAVYALSQSTSFSAFKPARRPLDRWLGHSTPHLVEDGIFVAAFPNLALACLQVPPSDFARDLGHRPKLQASDLARLRRKLEKRLKTRPQS